MRHAPSLSVSFLALATALAAQAPERTYTDPAERMARFDRHVQMAASSKFKGMRWQFLGPTNISGRVTDVAVQYPRGPGTAMFVAGASGGVWKSADEGKTWKCVFERAASTSIGDVTIAPSDPNTVWIGGGEANIFRSSMAGSGVYKSADGGATWNHMGLAGTHTIPRIVIHPQNPQVVYVAASGHEWTDNPERGLYKTTDGGKTWQKVLYISERTGVIDLVMHPTDPDTLYAASWQRIRKRWNDPRNEPDYGGSGIHKTSDGGKTWAHINKGLPEPRYRGRIGLDLCRSKPDVVYAFVDNYELFSAGGGGRDAYGRVRGRSIYGATVFRSDDAGASWRQTSEKNNTMRRMGGTYGWVFGQMRVDPNDADTIYVMGLGLNVSSDSGKTFTRLRGMHGDHHALWIDPDDSSFLVNGNDGGANLSRDGGKTWKLFNPELPMVQFFNVGHDMDTPFRVYGSIQDHGSRRAVVDLSNGRDAIPAQAWEGAPGGEGSSHAIDPTDPNIVYSAGFYGSISRTDLSQSGGGGRRRGRGSSKRIVPQPPEGEPPYRGQWLAPFIVSPHDPKTIYHGMNFLFRSRNRGDDFERISPDLTHNDRDTLGDIQFHTIFAISASPRRVGLVYVGTDDGRVHVTRNDGGRWKEINRGIARDRWISRLAASRYADGTVYMSQNGKRHDDFKPYLWRSTDYGDSWRDISGNIPLGPINVVREDPKNAYVLYVGTDVGVYVTVDGAKTWQVLGGNLPSTFVSDLIVHPRDDIIVISTHGRGMYAMDARPLQGTER